MIKVQTVAAVVTFGVLIFSGQTALAQVPADSAVKQVNLFESAEGNFRVAFPGKPQRSVSKVPTDLGNVDLVSFLYEASAKELYLVAYNDYPMDVMSTTSPDVLLQGAKESSIQSLGLRNVESEAIKVNGFPGVKFQGISDFYFASYKVVVVHNRSYQVAILKSGGSLSLSETSANFIKTFELVDPSIESYGEPEPPEPVTEVVAQEVVFTPPQGNFTIHFPADPELTTRMVNSDYGPLEMKQYACDLDEKQFYIIAYTDYPETLIESNKVEDLLQEGKKEALKALGIEQIAFEEPIQIGEHPGIHFRGQNGEQYIEYRVYMVKKRLFQMTILSTGSYPTTEEIEGFMNSFTLAK